ncbi:MAG TPA: hypothetical protein VN577_00160 [Terriglobales bacterium]|nr:hypothetical protein [Terriglobales bacterium]
MPRPTILVAEREPFQALSARKLVLETAKFNVITAHSTQEGLDLFAQFPKVSMVVMVQDEKIDCERIARTIREASPKAPIVALSPSVGARCDWADTTLSSHDPEALVNFARSLLGDPRNLE